MFSVMAFSNTNVASYFLKKTHTPYALLMNGKVYVMASPKPFLKPKPNKSKKFIHRLHHIKQKISHLPHFYTY